ncbi:hypothetical protein [Spongiimicrobium salis]|uniref:hypothetical protein n=1 Tax=Spongiimicrobium salis TaxID=1667022 RepID=UPI00374DC25D
MYQTYQNILAIPAEALYSDLSLLSYDNYKWQCRSGKLEKIRTGGNGRTALVAYASLPPIFKDALKKAYGDPYLQDDVSTFINQLKNNKDAYLFFQDYIDETTGKNLVKDRINQYYCEVQILTLYAELIERLRLKKLNGMDLRIGESKQEICDVIQDVKKVTFPNTTKCKFPHNLPSNYRALDNKLKKYLKEGYISLIHKAFGNNNSKKIKGSAADWILATYCLPNKPVIPVVHMEYMKIHRVHGWPALTESAISKWLDKTEQRKVWFLERHGVEEWRAEYGHKLTRNKNDWFPNAYWAIDGTKLDWLHVKDNKQGMGADIKIDCVFDVYSEKIIGYSFSRSETHGDHFKALKMASKDTMRRPFLFTYDGQSGHTTKEMQSLYDRLVARNRGEHYKHAARQHGSPVEQLFSRFQQQVLNTKWFSDKQAVDARKLDSVPNIDFIKSEKHNLHKFEDLEKVFVQCLNQWNEAKHPKFKESRTDVYEGHKELLSEPLTVFDLMDLYWVSTKKAVIYGNSGICPTISNVDYEYEVYDADGNVDLDFRDKYQRCKFFVQYDPDQMDNYVRLHLKLPNGNREYITDAQPKRQTKQIPATMSEKDKAQMWKDRKVRDRELDRIRAKAKALQERTGITPEQLVEDQELLMKFGGKLPKKQRTESESFDFLSRM